MEDDPDLCVDGDLLVDFCKRHTQGQNVKFCCSSYIAEYFKTFVELWWLSVHISALHASPIWPLLALCTEFNWAPKISLRLIAHCINAVSLVQKYEFKYHATFNKYCGEFFIGQDAWR